MKELHKIAIIGGTGKSGKYLVRHLLNQRYSIKILVRDLSNFQIKSPLIQVIKGDVEDYEVILTLIEGSDAVISALGLGIPPSKPSIFSLATKNIIRAMNACGVNRYILLTGLNVDTPFDIKGPKTKYATEWMYTNYPISTADRQLEYTLLSESNIDFTLVRLPIIEQDDKRYEVNINLEDCPGDRISATELAHFIIDQLTETAYIKKAPFIANL